MIGCELLKRSRFFKKTKLNNKFTQKQNDDAFFHNSIKMVYQKGLN